MELLKNFSYLSDASDEIDRLLSEANRTRGRKEKHDLLVKAQALANSYQKHCEIGGNTTKQFIKIL